MGRADRRELPRPQPTLARRIPRLVESHGIVKGQTWRIEHHLIDAPFVRVFQYEWNADGKPYLDPETREITRRDPYDVLVTSPPPQPEDYA